MWSYSLPFGSQPRSVNAWTMIAIVALLGCYLLVTTPAASVKHTAEELPLVGTSAPSPHKNTITTNLESTTNVENAAVAPKTELKINGEPTPLPSSGVVHKVLQNDNGNTTIDISVNSTSDGSSQTSSSTNIQLNTSTDSEVSTNNSE